MHRRRGSGGCLRGLEKPSQGEAPALTGAHAHPATRFGFTPIVFAGALPNLAGLLYDTTLLFGYGVAQAIRESDAAGPVVGALEDPYSFKARLRRQQIAGFHGKFEFDDTDEFSPDVGLYNVWGRTALLVAKLASSRGFDLVSVRHGSPLVSDSTGTVHWHFQGDPIVWPGNTTSTHSIRVGCPPGMHVDAGARCKPCEAGSFSTHPTLALDPTTCVACAIGSAQPSEQATSCSLCPPGAISHERGQSVCVSCDAVLKDSYVETAGQSTCVECPANTMQYYGMSTAANRSSCQCRRGTILPHRPAWLAEATEPLHQTVGLWGCRLFLPVWSAWAGKQRRNHVQY